MNIKFKNIHIKGFRSVEDINLNLENNGIVIVKGINDYEATASSNGSGKSSIFEAIVYALFEETSSGEKDISNRILNNGYEIVLNIEIDGVNYTIKRFGDKKSEVELYRDTENISARTKTDTNKLIIDLLGINKDIFLDSIFLSQNVNTNLTSLTPSARKERLELLTNTSAIIETFKEKLKEKQLKYENECVKNQMSISNINGKKEILNKQIYDTKAKINAIDEEILRRASLGDIQQINEDIKQNELTIEKYKNDIEQLNLQLINIDKELELNNAQQLEETEKQSKLHLDIQTLRDKYNSVDKIKDVKKQELLNIQNNIITIEHEISKIKNSDTCPTCGRKYDNINEEHLQRNIKLKEDDIQKLNVNIDNIQKEFVNLDKEMKQYEDELVVKTNECNVVDDKISEIIKQRTYIFDKQKNINMDKDNDNKEIQLLQDKILELNNKKLELQTDLNIEKEQLQKIIDEYINNINELDNDINAFNEEYTKNNNYVEVCKNAIQMVTKDFRTFLLQNSINYINNLLADYSKDLFSNDADIIKINDDSTKLNIMLGNATYESLSGGEKTKVDIALLLAQKSLASTIGDISSNIIILDEILKFCDSSTEINVIDLIVKELDTLESIYMISHKEIPIGYDTQLVIRKNERGLSNLL